MQGIPIRSRQILDELVDQLPWLLGDDIGLLLERLEAQLDDNPVSIFEQPDSGTTASSAKLDTQVKWLTGFSTLPRRRAPFHSVPPPAAAP